MSGPEPIGARLLAGRSSDWRCTSGILQRRSPAAAGEN